MRAQLAIIEGRDKGKSFPLDEGRGVTLGRGLDSDICLQDEKVSRKHFRIESGPEGFMLTDLQSMNGTFVQDKAAKRARLAHGQVIRAGNTQLQFLVEHPAPEEGESGQAALRGTGLRRLGQSKMVSRALAGLAAVSTVLALWGVVTALRSRTSSLSVESNPAGAMVIIDGQYAGQTPLLEIPVSQGPHLLRVEKYDFVPFQQKLDARHLASRVRADLRPLPTGTLELASAPSAAEVYVDGEFKGKTPLTLPGLRLGEHDVRLTMPEYLGFDETVAVVDDRPLRREVTLKQELVKFYEDELGRDPNNAQYFTEMAHLLILHQKFDEAIDALEKALGLVTDGKDTSGYASRLHQEIAKAYRSDHYDYGDYPAIARLRMKIEEMLERVTDRYPDTFHNYKLLIDFYQQAGRNDKIAALYGKAYQRMPKSWMVAKGYGTALLAASRFEEARTVFENSRKEMPGNWEAHYLHGMACLRGAKSSSEKAGAVGSLEQALKLCPRGGPVGEIRRLLEEAKR